MSKTIVAIVVATILGLGSTAWATIIETDELSTNTNDNFNSLLSATDLINVGQASLASASVANGPVHAGSPDGVHDGIGQDGGVSWNGYTFLWNPITFQYNLNTGAGGSAAGYDIAQVDVIVGWWAGEQYANQNWSLAVATVADPATFTTLKAVNYAAFETPVSGEEAFGYTHVKLTDDTGAVATGVAAIQVTMYSPCVVSEIDIAGTATVPEPSTIVLLTAGLIGLLAYAWRKGR